VTCFGVKGPSLIILQVDSTCDLFQKSVILHFMDALKAVTGPTGYTVVTFQKVHQKSNFVQAGIEYTYGQIFVSIQ
jgi:hypothetical protein